IEALPEVPSMVPPTNKVGSYKTKAPLVLYWRDGLDVVKHLFANPVFAPCMDFQPYREFEGADSQRAYGEFMMLILRGRYRWVVSPMMGT
ncbi:uncharacterized protein EDB91DRAFT_1055670, partial [Suillus paluster]|uniref:uncharacterized protein n=1 Tax=Suillus paluster TaxID=48578 RepID=UPI001B88235D